MRGTFVLAAAFVALVVAACTGEDPNLGASSSSGGIDGGGGVDGGGCAGDTPSACGPSCAKCSEPAGGGRATCNAGACGIECDAPKTACGTACVDLASDADNCGVCARKCGAGSSCAEGRCSTQTVATIDVTLQEIALAGPNVYFSTPTNIQRVAKAGGVPTSFYDSVDPVTYPSTVDPRSLSADALKVYWGGKQGTFQLEEGVFEQALAPAGATRIAPYPTGAAPLPLAVANGVAAWAVNGNMVYACEHGTGCAATTDQQKLFRAGTAGLEFLAVAGSSVAWTTSSGKVFVSSAADQQVALADTPGPRHLVAHEGALYWTDLGRKAPLEKPGIWKCAITGCDGAPKKLVEWDDAPARLAVDASGVYFTAMGPAAGTGVVVACRDLVDGCKGPSQPLVLVKGVEQPGDIEIDASEVFFVTRPTPTTGQILRVAK